VSDSYVTLTIFDATGVAGVEGFHTFAQAAQWTVDYMKTDPPAYPGWKFINADHHTDLREVLPLLDSLDQQARFFTMLGYDHATVVRQLNQGFPGEDAEAAYTRALAQVDQAEAALARAVAEEDAERTASGRVVTDDDFERLADEAQEGHPDA
jgi:hypothetical protein